MNATPAPQPARRRPRILPLGILVAVVLILVTGAVAAFAVPVVSLNSSRGLADMLPASTAGYLSVDLNPSGATRADWDRVIHAFTDQPGWKNLVGIYDRTTASSPSARDCYQQTEGQITSGLGLLGHQSGIALLSTTGIAASGGPGLANPVLRNAVFLGSLHVRMTLAQALSGLSLSLPSQSTAYRGVTIYQETFASCGRVNPAAPQHVYAALDKGYILLAVRTAPIERVIDVAAGVVPSLQSRSTYRALARHLPSGSLAGMYLNGAAWKTLQHSQHYLPVAASTQGGSSESASSALGVYARPDGLRIASVTTAATSGPTQPAGQIETRLPSSTLALVSMGSFRRTLRSWASLLADPLPFAGSAARTARSTLLDLSAHMTGETDLVLGAASTGQATASGIMPLSLLWQVDSPSTGRADLVKLVRRVDVADRFQSASTPDGGRYFVAPGQYGYGVRNRWAILSLQIRAIERQLGSRPASPLASVAALREAAVSGSTPTSIVYINLRGLRLALEPLLPRFGPGTVNTYRADVRPLVAPLQTFASRSATTQDGRYVLGTTVIRIG